MRTESLAAVGTRNTGYVLAVILQVSLVYAIAIKLTHVRESELKLLLYFIV